MTHAPAARAAARAAPRPVLLARGPLLALQLLACWPVGRWLARRLGDGGDEPLGLVVLGLGAWLLASGPGGPGGPCIPGDPATAPGGPSGPSIPGDSLDADSGDPPAAPVDLRPAAALTLLYALAYPLLPPLLRAALALAALGATLVGGLPTRAASLPGLGLLWLGLPLLASLQFYLGYPLRVLSGALATRLLTGLGVEVARQGTCLVFRDQLILVDAPCSGVRGLWVAWVLAAALGARQGLSPRGLALLLGLAGGATVLANGLRASGTFLLETGLLDAPAWAHEATGLLPFALVVGLLLLASEGLRPGGAPPAAWPGAGGDRGAREGRGAPTGGSPAAPPEASGASEGCDAPNWEAPAGPPGARPLLAACLLAALVPFSTPPLPPGPEVVRNFPWAGGQAVLMRTEAPTRRLHPAADCYRGLGYRVTPLPAHRDPRGRVWGGCRAELPGRPPVFLRELVWSQAGPSYPDPGSWYWSALLGQDPGPWWALRWSSPHPDARPGHDLGALTRARPERAPELAESVHAPAARAEPERAPEPGSSPHDPADGGPEQL